MIRADLHIHTSGSRDCRVDPARVLDECSKLGIDRICVTDHDTVDAAIGLKSLAGSRVIVGEEITTSEGELIGLFLTEPIPPGLPASETVDRIEAQGGLVYLQHPYDARRRHLSEDAIERIAERVHVVEVFNPRCDDEANRRAADLCKTIGAMAGAGSDAHRVEDIGTAFVELPEFSVSDEFLASLARSRVVARPNRALLRLRALVRSVPR